MAPLRQPPRTNGRLPSESHCNRCGGVRTHNVLNEHQTEWDEEVHQGQYIGGWDRYYVVQCAGCGSIHFRHDSTFSGDCGLAAGEAPYSGPPPAPPPL